MHHDYSVRFFQERSWVTDTLGCVSNGYKVTDKVCRLWQRIGVSSFNLFLSSLPVGFTSFSWDQNLWVFWQLQVRILKVRGKYSPTFFQILYESDIHKRFKQLSGKKKRDVLIKSHFRRKEAKMLVFFGVLFFSVYTGITDYFCFLLIFFWLPLIFYSKH